MKLRINGDQESAVALQSTNRLISRTTILIDFASADLEVWFSIISGKINRRDF